MSHDFPDNASGSGSISSFPCMSAFWKLPSLLRTWLKYYVPETKSYLSAASLSQSISSGSQSTPSEKNCCYLNVNCKSYIPATLNKVRANTATHLVWREFLILRDWNLKQFSVSILSNHTEKRVQFKINSWIWNLFLL